MVKTDTNLYLKNLQKQITHIASNLRHEDKKEDKSFDVSDVFQHLFAPNKVDTKSYSLLDSDSAYSLLKNDMQTASDYAAKAYETSAYDKKASVAEGLVFKNNRDFNFKV